MDPMLQDPGDSEEKLFLVSALPFFVWFRAVD